MLNPELRQYIDPNLTRTEEDRLFVPATFGHRHLHKLTLDKHPTNPTKRHELIARYSPLAELLSQPRSIEDFQSLKWKFLYLAWFREGDPWELDHYIPETLREFRMHESGVERPYVTKDYYRWKGAVDWSLRLADSMGILDYERVIMTKADKENRGIGMTDELIREVEGFEAQISQYPKVFNDIKKLTRKINDGRHFFHPDFKISRVGMIIGDFRVGDHSAHGRLIEKAKIAVGKHGWLVVVTPTKRTILNTTPKKHSWDDKERVYQLKTNRYINHIFVADMPEEDYPNPNRYWIDVWRQVNADLVFLGEKNHPLEASYRAQSRHLGGVLLIDKSPITARSNELLSTV